jgi:cytidyltransferase-like protein
MRIALSRSSKHFWTRNALLAILSLRSASGFLRIDVLDGVSTTGRDVIFDGLFFSMVTSDLIVAKMSGRELHWWVVLMATMVVMPHLQFLILCFVVFYYIAIFADLVNHMNLPLLTTCRNVYCDGIYDLCHVGHKNLFKSALKLGNRLFVGVVGDADANAYKRPPVMTAAERVAEVASCKCVTKVIPNSPCFGLTEEFIKEHCIHVVAFGQEYLDRYPNPDDDPYYKVPRKLGIAHPMPRTDGLSTSDLISRIQNMGSLEKKSPT